LAKDRQQPDRRFEVGKISFASYFDKFIVQICGWTERFRQVHRHYLILD
jgi:hypothetical protein